MNTEQTSKKFFHIYEFFGLNKRPEFALQLPAWEQIFPFFFAPSQLCKMHYARDRVTYMQSIQRLSNSVLEPFMMGYRVVHHIWNGMQDIIFGMVFRVM